MIEKDMDNLKVDFDELSSADQCMQYDVRYNSQLFTGTAIEEDDDYRREWNYVNGNCHGRSFAVNGSGQLILEAFYDNGKELSYKSWNDAGVLVIRRESDPFIVQEFDDSGDLVSEKNDVHYLRYYAKEHLCEEKDYRALTAAVYDYEGTWLVKYRFRMLQGHMTCAIPESYEYNDERWRQCYVYILAEDYPYMHPHFIAWMRSGMISSEQRSGIICDLIRKDELHLKWDGIELAGYFNVTDAIPLLRKEISNMNMPESIGNIGYAVTVGEKAQKVLNRLKS